MRGWEERFLRDAERIEGDAVVGPRDPLGRGGAGLGDKGEELGLDNWREVSADGAREGFVGVGAGK